MRTAPSELYKMQLGRGDIEIQRKPLLQSKLGRFLNADISSVLTASPTSFTDKNLFAYCDNNPISRKDSDGEFWHVAVGALVGAVGGAVSSIVSQALNGEALTGKPLLFRRQAERSAGNMTLTGQPLSAQGIITAIRFKR